MAGKERDEQGTNATQKALIGAAVAAGAVALFFGRRNADKSGDGETISDAPDHVRRDRDKSNHALVGKSVTVGKPKQEIYDFWRDFTRFPQFMDNVREVEKLDEKRSRWRIEAPAGTSVDLVTRITEDRSGETIAWESEPESQIATQGRVEFLDSAPGRGTIVRLTMTYDPPGGIIGRGIAKLFQREPQVQARRDLRRFKQLIETGEVTTNASPSGRGEDPGEPRL
ncbi:MAG: SRPBCC family protein [Pseudomonadota bacterium]|nr:SRPBCC family protein [Sphingomonas sp.]MDQ3478563.1 SRPBCC family protein [Pseudomonadota bacterium]